MRIDGIGRSSRGATWVAWLVGLLLLLATVAILVPVFTTVEMGHRSRRLSHVKQLVTSTHLYMADFDNHLPIADRWMDDIYPYLKNESILRDPELVDRHKGQYGFAFFAPVSGANWAVVIDRHLVPLIFQSSLMHRNAASDLSTLPAPARNNGGNIVGFLDGHVAPVAEGWPETPIQLKFREGWPETPIQLEFKQEPDSSEDADED